jgi:hypothetical protein
MTTTPIMWEPPNRQLRKSQTGATHGAGRIPRLMRTASADRKLPRDVDALAGLQLIDYAKHRAARGGWRLGRIDHERNPR